MSLSEAKDAIVPVVTAAGTTTTAGSSRYNEEHCDEDYFADVGFMFESQQPVRLEQFQWDIPSTTGSASSSTGSCIQIALHVADDHPGAVQSGHYLWPAAQMLSEYIIHQYSHPNITTVIELGAGCAMVSFVALQLWKETLQCLCITDHDPSTLVRARDNYETTVQQILQQQQQQQLHKNKNKNTVAAAAHDTNECSNHQDDDDQDDDDQDELLNDMINTVTNIPILYESLPWGDIDAVMKLLHQTLPEHLPLDLLLPSKSKSKSKSLSPTTASAEHSHVSPNHNHELSTMPNHHQHHHHHHHHHHHSFDIILGSDLIYCKEVVRPLFITAVQLMHPNHHITNTNCHSCFILAQSFVYDTITEQEIDDICQELQLQRTIVMDFHNNNNNDRNDNPSTITTGNGRIQEFRFITTSKKINEPCTP